MFLLVLCGLSYVGGYVRPGIVIDLKTSSRRGLLAGKTGAGSWLGRGASSVLGLSLRTSDRTLTSSRSMSRLPLSQIAVKNEAISPAPQHCHMQSHLCAEHLWHVDHGKTNDRRVVDTRDWCPEEPQQRGSAHGVRQAGLGIPRAEVRQRQHRGWL